LSPGARANGAFPDEFSIHFPANGPHRILIGTNFGLLVSEDDGATWRYSCEPYVTAGSDAALSAANVNYYQVTLDGAILADSVHVTRSADVGCTWPTSGGSVATASIADLFPDPNDAQFVLAIVANVDGTTIVPSYDGGSTFTTPIYRTPDLLTGIELSRSSPSVAYATKLSLDAKTATLLRSVDRGLNWTPSTILAPAGTQPRILAIDPVDSNTVYVRLLAAVTDSISITTDGGKTFRTSLTAGGAFNSFLRATDGTLYAGMLDGRLYVRPPGQADFGPPRAAPRLRCLGQRPGTSRIYACGDMFLDGFSLGYSDDGGQTFARVMKFTELLGPLACSTVKTACAAHWDRVQQVLGIGVAADAGTGPGSGRQPGGKRGCSTGGDSVLAVLAVVASLASLRRQHHEVLVR
jgi:photosystem II stability/assembly factor-like uncharacterized protein